MTMLDALARLLGLSRTDAEASMHSERAARHVLTRRETFGLAAAMCAGTVLGDVLPAEPSAVLRMIQDEMERAHRLTVAQWETFHYELGMQVQASSGPALTITGIDRARGIITVG
jgi:hypothetical protein